MELASTFFEEVRQRQSVWLVAAVVLGVPLVVYALTLLWSVVRDLRDDVRRMRDEYRARRRGFRVLPPKREDDE